MPWWLISTEGSAGVPSTMLHPEDAAEYEEIRNAYEREHNLWGRAIGLSTGYLLSPPNHPFRLSITSDHKTLSDDFVNGRIGKAISDRVIHTIETLEPGVHRYWPVDISFKDGSPAGRRWLLNICNKLQTLDLEKSKLKGKLNDPEGLLVPDFLPAAHRPLKHGPNLLFCLREAVAGHAIWCEYRFRRQIFISDELYEAFQQFTPPLSGIDFELQASLI